MKHHNENNSLTNRVDTMIETMPESQLRKVLARQLPNFQPPMELVRLQEANRKIMESVLSAASPTFLFLQEANTLSKVLSSIGREFEINLNAIARMREMEDAVKNDREYRDFPFLMAGYLPAPDLNRHVQLWLDGKKQQVKDELWRMTADPELQTELLKDLLEHDYFKKREIILRDALSAHSNGKFSLTIPALYPLIDGAFIETFEKELNAKVGLRYHTCPKCKSKPKLICPECGDPLSKYINASQIASHLKGNNLYDNSFGDVFGAIGFTERTYHSKRSKIEHGLAPDYYKERDLSTLLIMALSSVDCIIKEKLRTKDETSSSTP